MRSPRLPKCSIKTNSRPNPIAGRTPMSRYPRKSPTCLSRRPRSGQGCLRSRRPQSSGFGLLGAVFVLALFSVSVALVSTRSTIHAGIRRQVSLDRWTGRHALQLRGALITLGNSYRRLEMYRLATLAACPPLIPSPACPPALKSFTTAARAESLLIRAIHGMWKAQSLAWKSSLTSRGSYPEFEFRIPSGTVADLTTSWTLEYEKNSQTSYDWNAQEKNLRSRATLFKRGGSHSFSWTAAWTQ